MCKEKVITPGNYAISEENARALVEAYSTQQSVSIGLVVASGGEAVKVFASLTECKEERLFAGHINYGFACFPARFDCRIFECSTVTLGQSASG